MKTLSKEHKEAMKKAWIKRKQKGLGTPWNKGKPHTDKHKESLKKGWEKRRKNGLGEAWNKGKRLSPEHAKKCGIAMLGKKHSEETKEKMSIAHMGEKNHLWKEKPSYWAIHNWVRRKLGKASERNCKHCNKQAKHWANIDHKYKRNIKDYISLCVKCHKKFDGYGKKVL